MWLQRGWAAKWILAVVGICWLPLLARAASSTVRIPGGGQVQATAQNLERDFDKGTLTLSGNVQIMYNQQYLSCDRAVVNERTQEVVAEGNLIISSAQAYVEGERAILNYRDNTGVIEKGFVKSGQVIFEGSVVRKTGPTTYEADNSYYTACTTCPTAWTFVGTRMKAEIGGYAYIKNPVLEIANVPVLWLPYLIVPLKSERQTGLLVPSLDITDKDGFALGLRFFWAISRSKDATFTLKNYSNRGVKGLMNYRYMLSPESAGELDLGLLPHDSLYEKEPRAQGATAIRYFVTYDHSFELPYDINNRMRINYASDLWYQKDFWDEMRGRGDPALENRFSLTRNTERTHLSVDTDYYVNTLHASPLASNRDAVHRFPELRFATVEKSVLGGLLFNFNSDYVNFAREDLAFDDVKFVGGTKVIDTDRTEAGRGAVFNPDTDLIRSGQRLDLQPEISYPFRLGRFLDVLPVLQYRFTQYAFNLTPAPGTQFDTTPYRTYARARLSARTRYYRVYGNVQGPAVDPNAPAPKPVTPPSSPKTSYSNWVDSESRIENAELLNAPVKPVDVPSAYRHEIEPEFIASYIPNIIQSPENHDFFREGAQAPIWLYNEPISSADFDQQNGIRFDYYDRITDRTTLTAAITNRVVRKRWLSGAPDYRQIASLRNSVSYDFFEARSETKDPLPWSDVSSQLDVRLDRFESNSLIRYYPYHKITYSTSYVRMRTPSGRNYGELGYTQSYALTKNPNDVGAQAQTVSVAGGFISRYLDAAATLNYKARQTLDFPLDSWATDLNIKPPGNCWGIRVHYERQVGGNVGVKFNFDYLFGGETG